MRVKALASGSWSLLKETSSKWNKDNVLSLSAALSYYTVFSLAPLLVLATAVAGLVLGDEAIRGELSAYLQGFLGQESADAIEGFVANARKPASGIVATVTGTIALILGATGVFTELKTSLNKIWDAEPQASVGVKDLFKDRLLSFGMVVSIGFLLLVSMMVNAALSAASKYFSGYFPIPPVFLQWGYSLVSLGVVTVLFGMMYKFLPDKTIEWRDVWVGAVITAVLFTVGRVLIGIYLGKAGVANVFGASGSVVLILAWTYYSSVIVFFGAELTQVYSQRRGSPNIPQAAIPVPKLERRAG